MQNGNTRSLRYDRQTKTALANFGRQVALATYSNHVLTDNATLLSKQAKMTLKDKEIEVTDLDFTSKNVPGVHRRNLGESGYRSILITYHVCNHRSEDIGSKVEERAWYVR